MNSEEEWTEEEICNDEPICDPDAQIDNNDLEDPILSKTQKQKLENISHKLGLSLSQSYSILKENKWNSDQMALKILNSSSDNSVISLSESSYKYKPYFCKSCYSTFHKNQMFFMYCGHFLCFACLKTFFILSFDRIDLGAKCPFTECNMHLTKLVFEEFLWTFNSDKINAFKKFHFELANEDSQYYEDPNIIKDKCKCVYLLCTDCSKESHRPLTCKQLIDWHFVLSKFDGNEEWMLDSKCPNCTNLIEINKYCSKVKCKCGFQFCRNCRQHYNGHSFLHKCTTLSRVTKILKEVVSESNISKHFAQCLELKKQLKKDAKKFIMNLRAVKFVYEYNSQNQYLNFYYKAAKLVYKQRRTLVFASIAGYYISSPAKSNYYTFIMNEMKDKLDELSALLDRRLLVDFNVEFTSEKFNLYKGKVIGLADAIKNQFGEYINCIEAGFPDIAEPVLEIHPDILDPEIQGEHLYGYFDDSGWNCINCSYRNEIFISICDMCETERLLYT